MNYLILYSLLIKSCISFVITTDNKNINLCINCKYFIPSQFNEKFGKCDKYSLTNEVSGEKILLPACIIRKSELLCGKKGKRFEAKHKSINIHTNIIKPNNDFSS
jgi:serine kinase of HPr protein (carbohydrate metabolism regulator)